MENTKISHALIKAIEMAAYGEGGIPPRLELLLFERSKVASDYLKSTDESTKVFLSQLFVKYNELIQQLLNIPV